MKEEKKSFASIQLNPFETLLQIGKITEFLNQKPSERNSKKYLKDFLLFITLVLLLGVPAIIFNGFISETIPILRDTPTIGILPNWAIILLFILLPLSQGLVELPWFYGYLNPRLEDYFVINKSNSRNLASRKALFVVLIFFILQACLIPLILDPLYILWRAIAFLPLLLITGLVIRFIPRFMPGVNAIHVLMAIMVVLQFWQISN